MSIDPKKFGLSDSLVNAVNEALKGSQHKLDVAEPKGKLTSADFKKLRGEGAKPDFLDLDKDGNKKEPMKQAAQQVKEVSDAAKKILGDKAKEHGGKVPFTSTTYKDGKKVVTRGHNDEKGNRVVTSVKNEEVEVTEADDTAMKQIAAKKDAMKKQIQQKIAQKQMQVMQAKANKRISDIKASNDKCSCGSTNESKMKCEVHGGDHGKLKGGKESIEVNPPLKEASNLPKSVISKGHEIAKSLIKHRAKVREPYAVGMAQAKKSAGIKEDAEQVDEGNPVNKAKKNAAVAAIGAKNRDSQYLSKMNPSVADKIRGREKMSGTDRKQYGEEVDLDEAAIKTGNEGHGYHGNVDAKDDAERAKKYSAMHAKVKNLVGSAGHLKDAKNPNKMVKHFLDSTHGRHIADDPSDRNITSRFGSFKKSYKPHMHEGFVQVAEISKMKAIRTAVKRQTAAHGAAIERGDEMSDKEQSKVNKSQALIKKKYGEKGDKIVHKAVGKRIGYQD